MGWFNKKEAKPAAQMSQQERTVLPELPKLPELPELPKLDDPMPKKEQPHQLPSIPNNSFGKKFSQNSIKEAVTRSRPESVSYPAEKKGERFSHADDFEEHSAPKMMHKPQKQKQEAFSFPRTEEIDDTFDDFEMDELEDEEPITRSFEKPSYEPMRKEPVFIRIDKFEDALKTFDKTKKEIAEIEKALHDIAAVREDEDKELETWQNEIVKIKEQVDKVDADIFSRIE